jgi:hypothetical protein
LIFLNSDLLCAHALPYFGKRRMESETVTRAIVHFTAKTVRKTHRVAAKAGGQVEHVVHFRQFNAQHGRGSSSFHFAARAAFNSSARPPTFAAGIATMPIESNS